MREAMTALELAQLKLPGWPESERGYRTRAGQERWSRRRRSGRGGGWEYPIATLPPALRDAVLRATASLPVPASINAVVEAVVEIDRSQLATWQRQCETARIRLLQYLERRAEVAGSFDRAFRTLLQSVQDGTLSPDLAEMIRTANNRAGEGRRVISRSTIYGWKSRLETTGCLAPTETAKPKDLPPWSTEFLRLYRVPTKRSLAACVEALPAHLPPGVAAPSYDQVRKFLTKLSSIERVRGRLGPQALKSVRPYVKRTTDHLDPLDVIITDGHCHDMDVQHPVHGRPFRPELTAILDVATRRAISWSAALSEATWGTVDALRRAAETGIAAILYTDRGSGFDNDTVQAMLARIGTRHEMSLPYNSQARGIIERAHQSIWIRAARAEVAYAGRDMDRQARKAVEKITKLDLKRAGTSRLLMPWATFLSWAQDIIDRYNARPHRGLPKMRDPATGKMRHLSPDEAWQAARDRGWEPVQVSAPVLDDLFRPYELRKVSRGLVNVFGHQYFLRDLEHYHGDTVMVGYDIQDSSRVWVRDLQERLIGIAMLDGHAVPYFPKSRIEVASEQRAARRLVTVEKNREEILAELGQPMLDAVPMTDLTVEEIASAELMIRRFEPVEPVAPKPVSEEGRPIFRDEQEWVAWVRANPDKATDIDRKLLATRMKSQSFRQLHDFESDNESEAAAG